MWLWIGAALAGDGWAAIALGPPGKSGWATDQVTKEAAHAGALSKCAHPACTIELQIRGERCGSVAEGSGGLIAWSYGPEEAQSRDWALERCAKKDRGCRTVETVCNQRVSDWGDRWRSEPTRPTPAPPIPRPGGITPPIPLDPAVILACEEGFDGDANEDLCVGAVRGARFDPVGLVRACEKAFDGDASELSCVRLAAGAHVPIAPGIAACEAAFDGDASELTCLGIIVQSSVDATPYIQQCEASKDGDANELTCLRTVLGL